MTERLYPDKKPPWLRVKAPHGGLYAETKNILKEKKIVTVCEEAACPNIGSCWNKSHAAFMLMGDTCTRSCAFCNVKTGKPGPLNPMEPFNIALAVSDMNLSHVVITSVDRDDLDDGGVGHFCATIEAIRQKNPETTIEILTPDFRYAHVDPIPFFIKNPPDVFNHNLETVPRLCKKIRPSARYYTSIALLDKVKASIPNIFTKSGIMLGLGETEEEVLQVMEDLRAAHVDFLTIGQYLRPTASHVEVADYIHPDQFQRYEKIAYAKGFLMVSSSPLTRSSYFAGEDFKKLKEARMHYNLQEHRFS